VEAGRRLPVIQGLVLLVGDADILADSLVGDDFVTGLAQDAGTGDGELADDRVQFALVPDRPAQPAVLLKIARRMRHHAEDIGVAVLAEDFADPVVGFGGVAVFDTGHSSPWYFLRF